METVTGTRFNSKTIWLSTGICFIYKKKWHRAIVFLWLEFVVSLPHPSIKRKTKQTKRTVQEEKAVKEVGRVFFCKFLFLINAVETRQLLLEQTRRSREKIYMIRCEANGNLEKLVALATTDQRHIHGIAVVLHTKFKGKRQNFAQFHLS